MTVALAFVHLLHCPVYSTDSVISAASAPLYVHCLGASPKQDFSCVRLLTVRIHVGQEIEVFLGDGRAPVLCGKVELRGGEYFAHLQGNFGSGGSFEGKVELEKRFAPPAYAYSGYCIPFKLVVSHSADPNRILAEPFYQVSPEPQQTK
jgi:hypothetical protein